MKFNVYFMFNGMVFLVCVCVLWFFVVLLLFVFVLGGLFVVCVVDDFFDLLVVFKFSVSELLGQVDVCFKIVNGYYMYCEWFVFVVKSGQVMFGEL